MRFIGYTLQFVLIIAAFCIAGGILPQFVIGIFTWIAHAFLCLCLALWILELEQDFFFTAKVDIQNKAVLITGCDTGFGNAIAKILDKKGFHVYACCYDKMSDGASNLKDTCSSRLKVIQLDVTKDESVEEAVKTVEKYSDETELWAIVNNAGVLKGFHTELSSMKDYEDCIQVNTLGVIRVTKAFLPLLRKSKGRVVNVCSRAGRLYSAFLGPYCTSKHAAVVFTQILRQEMTEFGIRVISIEPEFFKTPMCSEDYVTKFIDQSLSEVNEEVKSAYGSEYMKSARRMFLAVFLRSSPDVKRVYNAIESAVSLQNPGDVYKPCRNIYITLILFLGERVSLMFIDLYVMVFHFAMGLPKPEKGVDRLSRLLKI